MTGDPRHPVAHEALDDVYSRDYHDTFAADSRDELAGRARQSPGPATTSTERAGAPQAKGPAQPPIPAPAPAALTRPADEQLLKLVHQLMDSMDLLDPALRVRATYLAADIGRQIGAKP